MDILVRTSRTKLPKDTLLVPLTLTSLQGEHVLLLMEIHGSEKDARSAERECLQIVEHALLETEGPAAERLDGALKELNGFLKGLLLSGAVDETHMILGILDEENTLHLSHAGRAEAYLVRRGVATQITEYAGRPVSAFVHIASGGLQARDVIILSTQRLLRALTPAQIAQLAQREDQLADGIVRTLDGEDEHAAIITFSLPSGNAELFENAPVRERGRSRPRASGLRHMRFQSIAAFRPALLAMHALMKRGLTSIPSLKSVGTLRDSLQTFVADLGHPKRKKRTHLLLLAGALAFLLLFWVLVHFFTSTQRSKTRAELETLVAQINAELQTADSRRLIGDADAANAILVRAEERAKQVIDNESGLFRVEALDLLDRIRQKREELNNVVRLSPPLVMANLGGKTPDILAQGLLAVDDGTFMAFDRQDLYRVLRNEVENAVRLSDDELLLAGATFGRFQAYVFMTTGNSVIELAGGQKVAMKTEDAAGWTNGKDIETYLRYLYVLSPENRQIYKYERLSGRYSAPVEYNVNADLAGALDMAVDGNVYVLKEGGTLVKLYRGETQPFVIRRAPDDALKTATKVFKVASGNFYFLDPKQSRIIVVSDGGATGEAAYVKQYVLEGEQVRELKDLYVNKDETRLYVLDEKRIYVIELVAR